MNMTPGVQRKSILEPWEKDGVLGLECSACKEFKEISQFQKSVLPGKYVRKCKSCINAYNRAKRKQFKNEPAVLKMPGCGRTKSRNKYVTKAEYQSFKKSFDLREQSEGIKKIVGCLIENPRITNEELATATGLSFQTVMKYYSSNSFLRALRLLATQKISVMLPLALASFRDSITSENAKVKFDASVKLLEDQKVLGPQQIDLTVNDVRSKSTEELQQILREAKEIPAQTIEADWSD